MALTSVGEAKREEMAAIPEFGDRLAELNERLARNTDRMQRVVDRAFGSPPAQANSVGDPRVVPAGSVGVVKDRVSDLHTLASQQSALLDQIDRIV